MSERIVCGGRCRTMRRPLFADIDQPGTGRLMMSGSPLESERCIVDP